MNLVKIREDLNTVRRLHHWAYAHRSARDGRCWMQMALDRHRFQRRIAMVGEILQPVLYKKVNAITRALS